MADQQEWLTADFDFDLPPERIAQQALAQRDQARLLHVTPQDFDDRHIFDLPDLLQPGDLLVVNDTKVIPARLYGQRGEVKVEVLLHKKQQDGTWLAFARPGKRLRVGDTVIFAPDFTAAIMEKRESGEVQIKFSVDAEALAVMLERYGEPPLPPYIQRDPGEAKAEQARYQTVYAAQAGAVAAPTAGLHFTPELFASLERKNIQHVAITLHVGAGTFLPVKAEQLKDHVMHAEWGEISAPTADIINKAKADGRRVVAVGTTALRLLESVADDTGMVNPFRAETDIFITPGYQFKIVDALLTNFHLPKSTLFMLVCAFAGVERMKKAYAHAIAKEYRFYSYGDATLLERG